MSKASESVTLTTLNDTKTITFDDANGLTIASEDGKTKIIISDTSISLFQDSVKVAEFNKSALKLGMNGTAENGAFIDLLNGLGKIASEPFGDSAKMTLKSQYLTTAAENRYSPTSLYGCRAYLDGFAEYTTWNDNSSSLELGVERFRDDRLDDAPVSIMMQRTPSLSNMTLRANDIYVMKPDGTKMVNLLKPDWTLIASGSGTKTVPSINGFSEFLLVCGRASDSDRRALASVTIPRQYLNRSDHADHDGGAHQAAHKDAFSAGLTYISDTSLKLYQTNGASCYVYAR